MGYLIDLDGMSRIRSFTGATTIQLLSDEQLNFYIDTEEALVMEKTGLKFYDTEIDEWHDGDGENVLILDHFPLRSVSEIEIDGVLVDSCCYFIYYDKGMLYLKDGYFTSNIHNVRVKYTYGAPDTSDTVRFNLAKSIAFKSVSKQVLLELGNRDSKGFVEEKLGNYSLSYGRGPYYETIKKLDEDIEKAYAALGITVSAKVL